MPCLNEVETLAICIAKARSFLTTSGIKSEVVIADNGFNDGSCDIAQPAGAIVVPIEQRAAMAGGIKAARGLYVIMSDADDSSDFSRLNACVVQLRDGADLVMGNRFAGGIVSSATWCSVRLAVYSFAPRLAISIAVCVVSRVMPLCS